MAKLKKIKVSDLTKNVTLKVDIKLRGLRLLKFRLLLVRVWFMVLKLLSPFLVDSSVKRKN